MYNLPLIPLRGVVLFPGSVLPLMDDEHFPRMRPLLERALLAPPPLSRLVAVVSFQGLSFNRFIVGCTAEIRKSSADANNGGWRAVARGRQRVLVDVCSAHCPTWPQPTVTVLPAGDVPPIPSVIKQGLTSMHPRSARPFDVHHLSSRCRQLCAKLFPGLALDEAAWPDSFHNTDEGKCLQESGSLPRKRGLPTQPLPLSYWLAANLPLASKHRQTLLEAPTVLHRLQLIVEMLLLYERDMRVLRCKGCAAAIVNAGDVLQTTDEGAGSAFCNAYGCVHDLATFARLCARADVRLHGLPEVAHSWYPGYAWTIASCSHCMNHLGWRFTAARDLGPEMPTTFWGIRRDALAEARPLGTQQSEDGQGPPGPAFAEESDSEYGSADGSYVEAEESVPMIPAHLLEDNWYYDRSEVEDEGSG
ncbi:hypothetical protein DUNSADRAFT_1520 [Dunaliella salina]|uniref:Protein cereblon n=1 Tax=Dunaliella salina TaxID=3046 RepID=A0ABQ7GWZ5_DUNSA|nr:hypothetical protein DUNSADRAFT_1520 [Dunaliella salina]|eukprot:KAF5839122.1 hypothetical protein DUNSADRAFT_1520 [Dunaliella salina]